MGSKRISGKDTVLTDIKVVTFTRVIGLMGIRVVKENSTRRVRIVSMKAVSRIIKNMVMVSS